ncbi:MAG: hypothetical protein EOO51_08335 [Flavobacterium sp.]|nr:MAG: hypothetical protein EOO51_08335 [Flavobacterium sp.]
MARNYFNDFIEKCIVHNQYVGLGNPNSKILLVGKEAGIPIGIESYHGSGSSWKENNYSIRFPAESKLRNFNHTWQKYQKLYELILNRLTIKETVEKLDKYEITFVENVFTTELSNLHAPNTKDAKSQADFSSELIKRKEQFWKDSFIDNFPIVIIFGTDNKYIETYPGEVCELFDVEFSEMITISKSEKIWVHYSKDISARVHPRLVIHTRHVTYGASSELFERIAEIVATFANRNSINIISREFSNSY